MVGKGVQLSSSSVMQGSCTSGKSGKTGKPCQIQGFSGKVREVFVLKVMSQGKSGKKFSQYPKMFSFRYELILKSIFIHCLFYIFSGFYNNK